MRRLVAVLAAALVLAPAVWASIPSSVSQAVKAARVFFSHQQARYTIVCAGTNGGNVYVFAVRQDGAPGVLVLRRVNGAWAVIAASGLARLPCPASANRGSANPLSS